MYKQAMAMSTPGLVPKILCSLSPLDIPMMLSLLSVLNSPTIHSSLSSLKNSHFYTLYYYQETQKSTLLARTSFQTFPKAWLTISTMQKSYNVSGASPLLLLTCWFLPTVSPPVWPPRLMYLSLFLLAHHSCHLMARRCQHWSQLIWV